MFSVTLQSSDSKLFNVDAASVKQMVTIQNMTDHSDGDSDDVIPVPVTAENLRLIVNWTEYHSVDREWLVRMGYAIQLFLFLGEIRNFFPLIIGADYLEVESLVDESCHYLLINHKWEYIEEAANTFHDPSKLLSAFKCYEAKHGYEVIVALQNWNCLKLFDPKVLILIFI